jgi:chorismate mutase
MALSMDPSELSDLRSKIDDLDNQIVDLLGERFLLVNQVGELKKQSQGEVYQPGREHAILDRVTTRGKALGLNPLLLQALFMQIFAVSKRNQV